MKGIIAGMAGEKYTDGSSSGFIISEQSQNHISGNYIQKVEVTEKVTDPLGRVFEFPIVHFLQQKFEIFARGNFLLLLNSSPIAKAFVGRLAEFSDFTISVEPLTFVPEKILTSFNSTFESVKAYAASIEELSLSSETTARLSFESSGKLEQEVRQFLKPRRFKFTAIKFGFVYSGQNRRGEIKSSGTVYLYGEDDPALTKSVLEVLQPFVATG